MSRAIALASLPVEVQAKLRKAGGSGSPFIAATIIVPFDALCPDNEKYGARCIKTPQGKFRAAMFLSSRYRTAKDRLEHTARTAMHGQRPAAGPVRLTVQCWFPDLRKRDMLNYAKVLCDSLKGVAFLDDSQIVVADWMLRGIDREAARMIVGVTLHHE